MATRRRGYTRVSSKNQVTIPVAVMERAGLRPGDELKVDTDDGKIVLQPAMSLGERRLAALEAIGDTFKGMYPSGYLDALRDEWER